jgi:hypothetical protein
MAGTCRQCRVGEETTARRRYPGGGRAVAGKAVGFGFIFYSQVKALMWMAAHAGAGGFAMSIGDRCRYDVL